MTDFKIYTDFVILWPAKPTAFVNALVSLEQLAAAHRHEVSLVSLLREKMHWQAERAGLLNEDSRPLFWWRPAATTQHWEVWMVFVEGDYVDPDLKRSWRERRKWTPPGPRKRVRYRPVEVHHGG